MPKRRFRKITLPEYSILKNITSSFGKPKTPEKIAIAKLGRFVTASGNIKRRRAIFFRLSNLLERHPKVLPVALSLADGLLSGREVPSEKKVSDFSARLNSLNLIARLNEISGISIDTKIVLERNFRSALNQELLKIFRNVFGVERISAKISANLIPRIFEYYAHAQKWVGEGNLEKGSFQAMVRAFVEEGPEGIWKLKFSKTNLPEPVFDFLKQLHAIRISTRPSRIRELNLFEHVFSLHLENFEAHAKIEGFSTKKISADTIKELQDIVKKIKIILNNPNLVPPQGIHKELLLKYATENNVREISRAVDYLKKIPEKNLSRREKAFKNAVLGPLTNLAGLYRIVEGIELFEKLLPEIKKMEKLEPGAQMQKIIELRQRFGEQNIEHYAKLFASIGRRPGKLAVNDIGNLFKSIAETQPLKAREKALAINARITYDLNDILESGEFGQNCLSAERMGYPIVGFTLDPQEFFLGFYKNKEYIGFSIIHIMQTEKGLVMFIERPYTNHTEMVPQMNESADAFATEATKIIKEKKIPLDIETMWRKTPETKKPLPPIHSKKYYDVLGKIV